MVYIELMKVEIEIILRDLEENFLNKIAFWLNFLKVHLASDAVKQEL
jgi:hypothetical protein